MHTMMDERKYGVALELVAEWVEELVHMGHSREAALQALLILVEMRMFATQSEDTGVYKAELEGVIRSQLGETQ